MLSNVGRVFLRPRSIAMVGATAAAHKAGGRRWLSAVRARAHAELFPINPAATELHGFRAFPSLAAIEHSVDLAVVMVPADQAQGVVSECARLSVGGVVVVSAGFGETGQEGAAAERQMVDELRERGARMLGPNSAGVFSAKGGLNTIGWEIPSGSIGLITQSGNIALSFTRFARLRQVGFSAVLAIGNGADLKLSELVQILLDDDETHVILIYCEGFAQGDGRRVCEVLQSSPTKKPVVLLKPGATEAGQRAVQSHTGSLAGDDRIAKAAFSHAGIYRATQVEEAFDVAIAMCSGRRASGNRIAVLSDGGGHATIVSDAAGRVGLELARLSDATRAQLADLLPVRSGIGNPVDFAGLAESTPSCIPAVIAACLNDTSVDAVIFAGHFGGYHLMTDEPKAKDATRVAEINAAAALGQCFAESGKPLIVHTDHGDKDLDTLAPLRQAGVPVLSKLENGAFAVRALCPSRRVASRERYPKASASRGVLDEGGSREFLKRCGLSLPPYAVVSSAAEAESAPTLLGGTIAMKLLSDKAIHKSDVGGVVLNVASGVAARKAFVDLMEKGRALGDTSPRVLAVPMVNAGVECIVGVVFDQQFGPAVLFGAGGVLVELVDDVSFALAPLTQEDAEDLVGSTRVGRILLGYRSAKRCKLEELYRLLVQLSEIAWHHHAKLAAIDLNPVIVNEGGAIPVDVRVVLSQ